MNNQYLTIKKQVFENSLIQLDAKIAMLNEEIKSLSNSSQNESKSSMGDKYETSREMIGQELERINRQLDSAKSEKSRLIKLMTVENHNSINDGSLVVAGRFIFFIGYGAGKIIINDKEIFSLSANSPFAQLVIGKKLGDGFSFMNQELKIEYLC